MMDEDPRRFFEAQNQEMKRFFAERRAALRARERKERWMLAVYAATLALILCFVVLMLIDFIGCAIVPTHRMTLMSNGIQSLIWATVIFVFTYCIQRPVFK